MYLYICIYYREGFTVINQDFMVHVTDLKRFHCSQVDWSIGYDIGEPTLKAASKWGRFSAEKWVRMKHALIISWPSLKLTRHRPLKKGNDCFPLTIVFVSAFCCCKLEGEYVLGVSSLVIVVTFHFASCPALFDPVQDPYCPSLSTWEGEHPKNTCLVVIITIDNLWRPQPRSPLNGGLVRQSSKMVETFRLRSYNKLPRIITIIITYLNVQSSFLFWNTRHERGSWSLWHWSLRVCWLVDGIHSGDQLQHLSQTRKTCCTSSNNKWSPLIEVKWIKWIHCILNNRVKNLPKKKVPRIMFNTKHALQIFTKKMVYVWSDHQHSLFWFSFRLVSHYLILSSMLLSSSECPRRRLVLLIICWCCWFHLGSIKWY